MVSKKIYYDASTVWVRIFALNYGTIIVLFVAAVIGKVALCGAFLMIFIFDIIFLIFFDFILSIYTATLFSLKASLREVFLSVDSFLLPIIKAQGTWNSPAGNCFV